MFFAACEGYFDKEREWGTVMREVAFWASGRASDEFNKGWPASSGTDPVKKVWGTKEDAAELRARIEKAHKIKLS